MNEYKITYMKENGVMYSRRVKAENTLAAIKSMGNLIIFQICKINEVGAIIEYRA